ncbi:hypothetical protein PIB30_001329 [Stylosanthes scabra]|uniref:Dirigent protein n=1 Tax=Stylosanthes scabra TaxID=79078 RepID=A0ABU6Y1G2_9FABA|nr:hypothetical protein [Stylosanthes scabra]
MEKKTTLLVLALIFCSTSVQVHSKYHSENKHGSHHLKEKVTNLHFFLFDTISGKHPTAVEISRPKKPVGAENATPFGHVYAIDDPLREGPHENSTVIGNARGLYLSSSQGEDLTLLRAVDFAFTTGEFNGSSFSVLTRNPVYEPHNRELAVVGGRGKFRLARGFALLNTYYISAKTGDAIIEYNVTIIHY